MNDDWLKIKKYPHIGKPLSKRKDKIWITQYVTNPDNITKHKFVPLLHRTLSQRKYRPEPNAQKNISGKRERTIGDKKIRHIYFPSHLDSIIYSYYNYMLSNSYEDFLKNKPFNSSVVAYRKIPIGKHNAGNKCNIEFAYEAFKFIQDNKERKLSIIVSDITSFFDNLDHKILHKQWKRILKTENLPDDHYCIYKSLVNKKYVNENELYKRFKNQLIVERYKPNDTTKKELKHKHVKKIYNLRRENVVAFCSKKDFFRNATDLIRFDKPNKDKIRILQNKTIKKGIPQGTPISATLANIYMLDFDEHIYSEVTSDSKKGYYQRYCDDIIIVCDQTDETYFYNLIRHEIEEKANLNIQAKKTNIYRYQLNKDEKVVGGIVIDNEINSNKQLEYLGFMFDGSTVRVKTAGFSKFYRKMKRSFKRGVHFAKSKYIPSNYLYETRLYKKYTHYGSKRRLKWIPDSNNPSLYNKTKQQDWGNFISYLNKANSVMKHINKKDNIKNQYKKIWNKFHKIKKETNKTLK